MAGSSHWFRDRFFVVVHQLVMVVVGGYFLSVSERLPDALAGPLDGFVLHTVFGKIGAWAAKRVYWPGSDWFERRRRSLYQTERFQDVVEKYTPTGAVRKMGDRTESREYVGTVTGRSAAERLEKDLWELGFVRNSLSHLKYRVRDGERQYETGNWVWRPSPTARHQLHVRLFETADSGAVDVYAHWEVGNIFGEDHLNSRDARKGVCLARDGLARRDVEITRRETLDGGIEPVDHDCNGIAWDRPPS